MPPCAIGGDVVSPAKKPPTNRYTFIFIVLLSLSCALVLSIMASALKEPQERARDLDRSRQMLLASKLISPEGTFLLDGKPARLEEGRFVLDPKAKIATDGEILEVFKEKIRPALVNSKGQRFTFEEAKISPAEYLIQNEKEGYAYLDYKLIYEILSNGDGQVVGYVIPVNGYGLWDAIYGYLAIETDGNTVIGITWYDQKETPGVGAVISDPSWQSGFDGKKLFGENTNINLSRAPLGIVVVKGKVSEVLGDSPKVASAVDGIPGATLTGNGVTKTIKDILNQYRPFLIQLIKGGR